jgi:predicted Co/Zn/Cd cation transporter (cation efflux family)
LEVAVAFVGFFLAFLVVRRPWVWRVLECSPELVALLGGMVALQMPQTLLFEDHVWFEDRWMVASLCDE